VTAERRQRIKPGEAAIFLRDIFQSGPTLYPTVPLLTRGMELAISWRQALHDCLYLALAEAQACEFVTADDQFARRLQTAFPYIVSLAALL